MKSEDFITLLDEFTFSDNSFIVEVFPLHDLFNLSVTFFFFLAAFASIFATNDLDFLEDVFECPHNNGANH